MVFFYHQVKEHPKLLLAMTGLTRVEFDQLLPHFQCAWDQYVKQQYMDRDNRQRQYGAGRAETTLIHIEDKLLFILYYVKVYPLQEILAFEFGMVRSSSRLPPISAAWRLNPVMFSPGRAGLAMSPGPIGSTLPITMGVVVVAS
jgi:hypothetical protein